MLGCRLKAYQMLWIRLSASGTDFIKAWLRIYVHKKMVVWVSGLVVELILNSNKRFCGGFGEGI